MINLAILINIYLPSEICYLCGVMKFNCNCLEQAKNIRFFLTTCICYKYQIFCYQADIFLYFVETIVGVNKFRLDHEDPVEVRVVDNTMVLGSQIKKLEALKANRDSAKVRLISESS